MYYITRLRLLLLLFVYSTERKSERDGLQITLRRVRAADNGRKCARVSPRTEWLPGRTMLIIIIVNIYIRDVLQQSKHTLRLTAGTLLRDRRLHCIINTTSECLCNNTSMILILVVFAYTFAFGRSSSRDHKGSFTGRRQNADHNARVSAIMRLWHCENATTRKNRVRTASTAATSVICPTTWSTSSSLLSRAVISSWRRYVTC